MSALSPTVVLMQDDILTDLDRAILDFEKRWFRHAGAKDKAIYDTFDMKPIRYTQRLMALIDNPAAAAYAPQVVNRLRRLREQRRAG